MMLEIANNINPEYPAWMNANPIQGNRMDPNELIEIKNANAWFLTFEG